MSDYPMLISNKLHSFRNFLLQYYEYMLALPVYFSDRKNERMELMPDKLIQNGITTHY